MAEYEKRDVEKANKICEPGVPYTVKPVKKQGEYTIEDYLAWPEDERIELIDGVIYDMAAPTGVHQLIIGKLHSLILNYIEKNKGKCIPVFSPIDVQLDRDNRTMVQPDLIVLCKRDKFQMGRVFGEPDLVVEVLSPSSKKKDTVIKLNKYRNAGVREYWVVDPDKKNIVVYDLENNAGLTLYSFMDKIPVGIFEGKCEVDFAEVYQYVSFLYEED